MGILDGLVGIKKLEQRIARLEQRVKLLEEKNLTEADIDKIQILELLDEPRTTDEIADMLGKRRSWASKILNQLEKENKVKELGKRGREDLYVRM